MEDGINIQDITELLIKGEIVHPQTKKGKLINYRKSIQIEKEPIENIPIEKEKKQKVTKQSINTSFFVFPTSANDIHQIKVMPPKQNLESSPSNNKAEPQMISPKTVKVPLVQLTINLDNHFNLPEKSKKKPLILKLKRNKRKLSKNELSAFCEKNEGKDNVVEVEKQESKITDSSNYKIPVPNKIELQDDVENLLTHILEKHNPIMSAKKRSKLKYTKFTKETVNLPDLKQNKQKIIENKAYNEYLKKIIQYKKEISIQLLTEKIMQAENKQHIRKKLIKRRIDNLSYPCTLEDDIKVNNSFENSNELFTSKLESFRDSDLELPRISKPHKIIKHNTKRGIVKAALDLNNSLILKSVKTKNESTVPNSPKNEQKVNIENIKSNPRRESRSNYLNLKNLLEGLDKKLQKVTKQTRENHNSLEKATEEMDCRNESKIDISLLQQKY